MHLTIICLGILIPNVRMYLCKNLSELYYSYANDMHNYVAHIMTPISNALIIGSGG